MTRLLGPATTSMVVRQAVKALLTPGNVGVYADEIVRREHPPGFDLSDVRVERIRDVVLRESRRLPEHQLPCLVVRLPDVEADYADGYGVVQGRGVLQVMVAHVSTDDDGEDGEYVASVLARAVALLLVQNLAQNDGPVSSCRWLRDRNAEVVDDDSRARHGVLVEFELTIRDVMNDAGGPLLDLPDPPIGEDAADPGDLPPVETTTATTTPVEEID